MKNQGFNQIETDNLILRRFKEKDAEHFYAYRTHPEIRRYQGEGWCDCTYDKLKQFIQQQTLIEPGTPKQWFRIAIEQKNSGELIGDLGIYKCATAKSKVQMHIVISPDYQNEGYALEAIEAALDYTFKVLEIDQVVAITDIRNTRSVKLLEKLRFNKQGNFVNNSDGEGVFCSEHFYVMKKEDWLYAQAI